MHALGLLHVMCSLLALGAGAAVLLMKKGTVVHRRLGWAYAVAILSLNGTALFIYRLFGFFGPFHVLALVSLGTLIAGVLPAWRKRPRATWVSRHYTYMAWSYLGLAAAFVAELAVRLPMIDTARRGVTPAFGLAAGAASGVVCAVGAVIIARRRAATLGSLVRSRRLAV